MPSDFALKTMNNVHRFAMKVTGGKFGWQAGTMPILELTTIGRKSGQPRAVLLSSPLEVNGNRVIVASRGGDDTHPAWFLNLRDNPKVDVVLKGGPKTPMNAHIATAEERAEMWPKIATNYKNYRGYQAKTSREIPLVVLTPRA
jgi:deazaflavin-dependent oxidoreductase (nitroreductase family)